MIPPEIAERLTPERIAKLSVEEKRELLSILEALRLPRLERLFRAVESTPRSQLMDANEAVRIIEANRKRLASMSPEEYAAYTAEFDAELAELDEWRKHNASKVQGHSIENEWRALREQNPRAGGVGVDHLLGVPTPDEPTVQHPIEAKPEPKAERVLTPAEAAKAESERVQIEAAEFQRTDFLSRLCGDGSLKPSGTTQAGDFPNAKRSWYH